MNDEAIVEAARSALAGLQPPKLWMTARFLSRRLRKRHPELRGLSQVELFDVLTKHAARGRGNRAVRNSPYPSDSTLEVLWGAVEKVDERDVEPPFLESPAGADDLPRPAPAHAPGDPEAQEETDAAKPYFLSYNFKDAGAAHEVAAILERKGHPVWLAGARIAHGEFINERVKTAIGEARGLLLYLSAESLRSLWVAKEQIVGQALDLERTIVVKGDDPDLMTLVRHWLDPAARAKGGEEPGIPMHQTASRAVAEQFRAALREDLAQPDRVVWLHPEGSHADGRRLRGLADFPDAAAEA